MRLALIIFSVILVVLVVLGGVFLYLRYQEDVSYRSIKNNFEFGVYENVVSEGTKFLAAYPKSKYYDEVNYYVSFSIFKLEKYDSARQKVLSTIKEFFNKNVNNEFLTKNIELLGDIARIDGGVMDPSIESFLKTALIRTSDESLRRRIMTQLGYIFFYRKEYNNALMYFQYSSGDELAELGKARVYIEMGEYEKAFYVYDSFLDYRKDSKYYKSAYDAYQKQLYGYAFRLLQEKKYDRAGEFFAKVVEKFKGSVYEDASLYWLGEIYAINKMYTKAINFFDRAMSNEPKNKDEDALFKKAVVLYQSGEVIDAIATFRKFILEYPNSRLSGEAKKWVEVLTKELQYVDTEED